MSTVVISGGGWSGCAAALSAAKAGAKVILIERTDLLLGTGLVGGIFRNNGRYTAAEESVAMGGGEFFKAMDENSRHTNIDFPGHRHASLYDVTTMEPIIRKILLEYGVEIKTQVRVNNVKKSGRHIEAIALDDGEVLQGDAFIDATGSAGPMGNCLRYGNGCAMCILRCPSFGPRISLTGKAGVKEFYGEKADGSVGAMSGSCKINKDSLSDELKEELERKGVVVLKIPEGLRKKGGLLKKACSQYALEAFAENIILLDTGHAKLMTSYFPLQDLRKVHGLEKARYEDPYSGGVGNSMRYLAIAPCDATLRVADIDNLFCAGEKAGTIVGHTEAIVTGLLAGHNAVRCSLDMKYLVLPNTIAIGDFIEFVQEKMRDESGRRIRYTFSGSVYFNRMKEEGLYEINSEFVQRNIEKAGLKDIYHKCLV